MSEKLEKQFVVSRRSRFNGIGFIPWKWFDARSDARAFVKAKTEKLGDYGDWAYRIDPVTRGPHS